MTVRRRRVLALFAVLALLGAAYAFTGVAMDADFYTSSHDAQFRTGVWVWTAIMLTSVLGAIGLAVAAWRGGRS